MKIPIELDEWKFQPVPDAAQQLFRMCWQLENWFRMLVYVELRAHRHDWVEAIQQKTSSWPPRSQEYDKKLHHMTTSHQSCLSYLSFGELWEVIVDKRNWPLFSPYFPPIEITKAKISEVKAIRNRIAHFRDPNARDVDRLRMFLGDMDPGFVKFCLRYNNDVAIQDLELDPVTPLIVKKWKRIGYGIEMLTPHDWLYAPSPHTDDPLMNATLEMLFPPNWNPENNTGIIYRLRMRIGDYDRNRCDPVYVFEQTKPLHSDLIHFIIPNTGDEVSVTFAAHLGPNRICDLVRTFLSVGLEAKRSPGIEHLDVKTIEWPEYVLLPNHILSWYLDVRFDSVLDCN